MGLLERTIGASGPSLGRRVGRVVLDTLFPRVCGLCETPEIGDDVLCDACCAGIERARAIPYCVGCGATVGPFGGTRGGCPSCQALPFVTAGFARVGPFAGDLAQLIRSYKFRKAEYLDRYVGRLLADAIVSIPWFGAIDLLTWVPTCWQHRLKRGFHAASATAPHVARHTGLPPLALLHRVRGGPHQVGLSLPQRLENVKGKFKAARGVALNGASVCIIDDVATSGATVNECARVLKRAGASKVYGAVVARAGWIGQIAKDV